jgi:hypothetical protein
MRKDYRRIQVKNERGEWVPGIPEPFYGIRKTCTHSDDTPSHPSLHYCGKKFWTYRAYQAHYALEHILGL